MELVDANIVATSIKVPQKLFARNYSVTPTQQYHLKVQLKSSQYVIKKRFSEFYAFYSLIKKFIQYNPAIPAFPPKSLRPMSNKIIFQRKVELEFWIKSLIKNQIQVESLSGFLCVSQFNEKGELSSDEVIVKNFIDSILKNPNRKIAFLDKFEKEFFARRRIIDSDIAEELFEALIPLCGDYNIMGKSLDVISKLLNRDYYRFYDFMIGVFCNLPLGLMNKMNLKDYIKQRISPDSQRKAYEVLTILQNNDKNIEELLGYDQDAVKIYRSWGMCEPKMVLNSYKSEVISLIRSKELNLDYRIEDKTVQVTGCFETLTTLDKIVELVTSPFVRKEWDLRLRNMFEDDEGFKMYYEMDNKVYEYDAIFDIQQNPSSAEIKITGLLSETDLGEFSWTFYAISIMSNDSIETGKVRCNWVLDYKGKATKLIIYDLIGEENLLQNSFRLLFELSQMRSFSFYSRCKTNSMHESIIRKSRSVVGK